MDYPSNTNKDRDENAPPGPKKVEAKKIESVVVNDVSRRKKPLSRRFREVFVGGDAKSVWSYIFMDVMIPAAKDMLADAGSQGLERMLFGEAKSRGRTRYGGSTGYTSYNRVGARSVFQDPRRDDRRELSRRSRANHDFDDIILATKAEADEVIDGLFEIISKYEVVTVKDLYELVGISSNYTDEKWGWTDLRGAGPSRIRNGWLLDLPRPEPLD